MGFFSFLNKNNAQTNGYNPVSTSTIQTAPDIPENVFIEKANKTEDNSKEKPESSSENGINLLFQFLDRNHEAKGYDDALVNPDGHHLAQNIEALENELVRTIRKVKTFYEDFISEIDFHISSRSGRGMVDIVDELRMKKGIAERHIKKVQEIEEDANNKKGDSQGIIISYTRGFKNGLAAISSHSVLNKKF